MLKIAVIAAAMSCVAAMAAARPPEIEDVLMLREIGGYRAGLALSPDGAHVAFFERDTRLASDDYQYRLVVVPVAGGAPHIAGHGGGAILHAVAGRTNGAASDRVPAWSPDGEWLAYLRRVADGVQLWRARPDGGEEMIAAPSGDVTRFVWLGRDRIVFETATPRAAMAATALRQARFGFHVDDRFEPYYSLSPRPDPDGERAIWVVNASDRTARAATDVEARALEPAIGRLAPTAAVALDEEHGTRAWVSPLVAGDAAVRPRLGLFVLGPGDHEPRRCLHAECSGHMTGAWLIGSEVVFHRHEGHGSADTALYAWRPASDALRLVRRGDEALLGCDDAADVLVCFQESAIEPRRLVAIHVRDGSLQALYDPNPDWRRLDLTRVERLSVHDAYANEGYAHLVWPAGYRRGRRYPLVIVQYRSRGFLRGGTGGEYPVHALAGRGYFVLSVERTEWFDLEAELSGPELQLRTELDGSESRMKQTQLEALIALLDERGLIDPERVGITGLSDGAETLYFGLTHSRLFAAAVASSPPIDPLAWTLGAEQFRRGLRAQGASGPWADAPEPWRSWWQANSAVLGAEAIDAPLLMNLSDGEALLGFPLAVRLGELGRAVDVYIYPGEHHVKHRPLHLLTAQRRALDWLDFWLRGVERGDPDEPGRLARWRALRTARERPQG